MKSPVLQKKPHIEESTHDVSSVHVLHSSWLYDMLEVSHPGEGHRLHDRLKSKLLNIVEKSHLSHDVYSLMSQSTYMQCDSDNENLFHFLQDGHRVVTLDIRQTPPPSPPPENYQCSDGDPLAKLSQTLDYYLSNFKMILNNFHSPVLPIVNSTGLGKTRLMLECVKTFDYPNTRISYFSFSRIEKNRNNSENVCYTWPPTVKLSDIFQDFIPLDKSYSLEQRIAVVVIDFEWLIVEILQESPLDTVLLNTADGWMKYSKSIISSTSSRFLSFVKSCKQPFDNQDHAQFVESLIQDLPMDKYVAAICIDKSYRAIKIYLFIFILSMPSK
ncbi:hypothetical protein P9112_012842 [Eukaryota sp. TZLM1-RC]